MFLDGVLGAAPAMDRTSAKTTTRSLRTRAVKLLSTGGLYITEQIVIGKMEAEIQASDEAVRVWCHGASANRSIRVKDSE